MMFSRVTRQGRIAAAAALLLVLPAKAIAQEYTESHLAAARDTIEAIDATDQFDNILMNAATQTKSELIPNNPDMEEKISAMVDDRALALASRRAALENEVARVYAKLFTEEELRAIADFYQSEPGKKLLAQGPTATREMMAAAQVWSNGIVRDLRQSAFQGMNELYGTAGDAPLNGEAQAPIEPMTPADATQ